MSEIRSTRKRGAIPHKKSRKGKRVVCPRYLREGQRFFSRFIRREKKSFKESGLREGVHLFNKKDFVEGGEGEKKNVPPSKKKGKTCNGGH